MAQASRDQNNVPTLLGVSSSDGVTPIPIYANPTTHRLLIDSAGGAGTVTSVSVVTANGFAGSVATATTTPAITLSTTITGILKGNGTVISAATVGTDYAAATTGSSILKANGAGGFSNATAGTDYQAPITLTTTGTSGAATFIANTLNIPQYTAGTGDMVLASAQTVTGAKTYNINTLYDKGSMVFNVRAYGATGNGSTDDTAAIQSAVDAAHTAGGGTVWFPNGTYKLVTNPIKLYSGTTPNIVAYSNITLAGAGSSGTGGSILTQTTTGIDCIKAVNDAANGAQALNNTIKDIAVVWGTATLTNSGNGIYLSQQSAGGPSFQQWNFENVIASGFQGSGKYGFNMESVITSTIDTCQAVVCANGFYLNGAVGGAYNSVSTSVNYISCYANMAANGVNGFNCLDNTYVNYLGCAVDIGANSTGTAYLCNGSSSVTYNGCGCELDGTHTLTNMWQITGSAGIGLYNNYSFQSNNSIDVYVTGSSTGVTIIGHNDNSTISGSTGLKVDNGSQVTEIDTNWGGVATPRNLAAAAVDNQPGIVRTNTIASSATPSPNAGTTDEFTVTALAATATFAAPGGTPINGQGLIIRIKDNGTARTLAWNGIYRASSDLALPTTTIVNKTLYLGFKFNSTSSTWDLLALLNNF